MHANFGWELKSCYTILEMFVVACMCSVVSDCSRPHGLWTVVHRAPLSVEFSRPEYGSRLPFPTLGELPNPGINPASLVLLHWQVDSLCWATRECRSLLNLGEWFWSGKSSVRLLLTRWYPVFEVVVSLPYLPVIFSVFLLVHCRRQNGTFYLEVFLKTQIIP